jgi:hypothetical protein
VKDKGLVDKADAPERPEADEGFPNQGMVRDKSPVAAVKAVEPIVTHDEVMPFGDANPKFAPVLLNQIAVGVTPWDFI